MLDALKKLFGFGPATDYVALMKEGAILLDVRSPAEYQNGHIPGSINIPVDALNANLSKIKDKNKTIITCCASGMRSASATATLRSQGYTKVYNGGGWSRLQRKLKP